MSSRRLPGKVLMDLAGKPVLQHVVERARRIRGLDDLVVASPAGDGEPIAGHCEDWGVRCILWDGPIGDVLGRFCYVLDQYPAVEYVLRICADAPLLDPAAAAALLAAALRARADYAAFAGNGRYPILRSGYFSEVISAIALRREHARLNPDDPRREHVAASIYRDAWAREGTVLLTSPPDWWLKGRLPYAAIDTRADLERAREAMECPA